MNSSEPIQLIAPVEHKFQLQHHRAKQILEADEIKDRNVVVVSVTGAFRKGKSFLLNFFLKYLRAQYKKHDVSDWLGEQAEQGDSAPLSGFEFAGGRKPKTIGIWMWSEIFTHDFDNGEKVAIILMDTQGIFDSQTTLHDNTTIFAISMMLSSVQCYNVMQNIQEDDLQHLELFTEYGLLALNQSQEKPFQKLLFIVRDWPNADEIPYGDGKVFIDELMAERTTEHTSEMKQLRRRIKSSFDRIGAFLMPYPGSAVANGRNANGDLRQIDSEFIESLKRLVPSLLAPENLIQKKINGQKVRARDLIVYLQSYVSLFNDGNLPEPNSVLKATAMTILVVLSTDCLNAYSDGIRKSFDEKSLNANEPYLTPLDLKLAHDDAKDKALSEFRQRKKLGDEELITTFKTKLLNEIALKYQAFGRENQQRARAFKAKVSADLRALQLSCVKNYVDTLQQAFNPSKPITKQEHHIVHQNANAAALEKFNNERKLGSEETIEIFRTKLESDLNLQFMKFDQRNDDARQAIADLQEKAEEDKAAAIAKIEEEEMLKRLKEAEADMKNLHLLSTCVNAYKASLENSLRQTETFHHQSQFDEIHEIAKADAISKFERDRDNTGVNQAILLSQLENELDTNFIQFSYRNEAKRREIENAEQKERLEVQMAEMRAELANARQSTCIII